MSRELCNGLWVVPLAWTGESGTSHELTAVFDTGGSDLFIDPDGLERASGRRVQPGRTVRMEGVSAQGLEFTTFRPRVREMSHLGAALGKDFDVFLPFGAFDGRLIVLDYPAGEMRIETGSLPEPDGETVFSSRGPDRRPWLRVDFPDRARRVLIDSGSNGRLQLKRRYGLEWLHAPRVAGVSTRFDKYTIRRAARVRNPVRIANLEFDQPIVSLTSGTELMGVEVLKHFVLTFDGANDRVRFQPAQAAPVRMEPERGSGAIFRADPEGFFEVAHVHPGTPADRAGLRPGDRAVERNGVPVLDRGCRQLDEPEPATTRWGIDRGGRVETIELELVDIID
ncbi:PDZ domain-containing protein [Halomonas denitrificans]|nr:hypothetical protein [Halomonas denitrificans]